MTGQDILVSLAVSGSVGFVVGLVYFRGLWWTARRAATSATPGPLLATSFVLRMALLVSVLYAVTRGAPWAVASALVGTWLARMATFAYVRKHTKEATAPD